MVTVMDIINEHNILDIPSIIAVPSAFSSALFPWQQHHSPPSAATETWPTVVIKFHTCTSTCTSSTPHILYIHVGQSSQLVLAQPYSQKGQIKN